MVVYPRIWIGFINKGLGRIKYIRIIRWRRPFRPPAGFRGCAAPALRNSPVPGSRARSRQSRKYPRTSPHQKRTCRRCHLPYGPIWRNLFRRFSAYPTWPRAHMFSSEGEMVVYGCCALALENFDTFLLPNIHHIGLVWKQPILNHARNCIKIPF